MSRRSVHLTTSLTFVAATALGCALWIGGGTGDEGARVACRERPALAPAREPPADLPDAGIPGGGSSLAGVPRREATLAGLAGEAALEPPCTSATEDRDPGLVLSNGEAGVVATGPEPPGASEPTRTVEASYTELPAGLDSEAYSQDGTTGPRLEDPSPPLVPASDDPDGAFFHDALAGHGAWIEVEGSWAWRPAVVATVPYWRPYCDDGFWVYTDLGWAWHSNYVWGWAPFHYGRWGLHPVHGWIWYPGMEWAPAWVEWRVCEEYYGWAPLPCAVTYEDVSLPNHDACLGPVTYVFVRREHLLDRDLRPRCIPYARTATFFAATTRLTRNYAVRGGHICNWGPEPGGVERSVGRTLKPLRIVDAVARPGRPIPRSGLGGDALPAFRPDPGLSRAILAGPVRGGAPRESEPKARPAHEPPRSGPLEARDLPRSGNAFLGVRERAERERRQAEAKAREVAQRAEKERQETARREAERAESARRDAEERARRDAERAERQRQQESRRAAQAADRQARRR